MEPGEALSTAAQIATALAGFAGVVVAFRSSSLHEWSSMDRFRLLLLLGNALIPLFACLFAMLWLTIKPTPLSIWHWGSGFWFLLILPFSLLTRRRQAELEIKDIQGYRYLFYGVGSVGTAIGLLQVYNALVSGVFWLFYAVIMFQLAVGALQFARMILLPPHPNKS